MAAKHIVPIIIFVIFFVTQPAQGTEHLSFACANGFITDILGVDKANVVVLDESQYCHFNKSGCRWQNRKTLNVLYVPGEKTLNIAGGKNAQFYNLECKTAGQFVASVSKGINIATVDPTKQYTTAIVTPNLPIDKISLSINDKDGKEAKRVTIGEQLFLNITGPENYKVEPLNCTANIDTSGMVDYTLWENDGCSSADTAIIDGTWTEDSQHSNTISVKMYGFRFVTSHKVVVTCTAHFCPKDDNECYKTSCVNNNAAGSGRKRRNAYDADPRFDEGYTEESFSTTFTVIDSRVDSSACSGPFVSVFMYITTVALVLGLL